MSIQGDLPALAEEAWEASLRENPVGATYLGDFRWNHLLADLSPEARERRRRTSRGFLDRLDAIDASPLDEADRVTAEALRLWLEHALEEDAGKFWQWEVDQMAGPQADFPQLVNFHPPSDLAGLEARYRAFPAYIAGYLENLREGLREGRRLAEQSAARAQPSPPCERHEGPRGGLLSDAAQAAR